MFFKVFTLVISRLWYYVHFIWLTFQNNFIIHTKGKFNRKLSFPSGTVVKSLPANAKDIEDERSTPGLERSPGIVNGNPPKYLSGKITKTEEPGRLQVHGVTKSWTQLSTTTKRKLELFDLQSNLNDSKYLE